LNKSRYYFQMQMTECECDILNGSSICLFSNKSPDKEGPNEDAAAVIIRDDTTVILAVADGVGGLPAGAWAAETSLKELATVSQDTSNPDVRASILNGIEQANSSILAQGSGSATTLAVAEIQNRTIRPYHIGDSVVMVVGQRGKLKLQTLAHAPVSYAVEAGFLDEHDALHHQERHLVSNFVGTSDMRVEVGSPLSLDPRDTLLLASDGLFDNVHIPDIVEIIRKGPLKDAGEKLIALCRERMAGVDSKMPSKPDDTTFILYRRQ